jgi:hypothetical protein
MEVVAPDQSDLAAPVASNSMPWLCLILPELEPASRLCLLYSRNWLPAARGLILKLEEDKLRMAKEVNQMKHDVMNNSTLPPTSAAAVSPTTDAVSDRQDHLFDTVLIVLHASSFLL